MPSAQTDTSFWSAQQRSVPIFTPADVAADNGNDNETDDLADELENLLAALPSVAERPDVVVLFDATGRGVWSCVAGADGGNGGGDLLARGLGHRGQGGGGRLRDRLGRVLRGGGQGGEGEAMDFG